MADTITCFYKSTKNSAGTFDFSITSGSEIPIPSYIQDGYNMAAGGTGGRYANNLSYAGPIAPSGIFYFRKVSETLYIADRIVQSGISFSQLKAGSYDAGINPNGIRILSRSEYEKYITKDWGLWHNRQSYANYYSESFAELTSTVNSSNKHRCIFNLSAKFLNEDTFTSGDFYNTCSCSNWAGDNDTSMMTGGDGALWFPTSFRPVLDLTMSGMIKATTMSNDYLYWYK